MSINNGNWSVQIEGIRNPLHDEILAAGLSEDRAHEMARRLRPTLVPGQRLLIASPDSLRVVGARPVHVV